MEQSVLNAYVEIERQIKQLEEQKAMLRTTIFDDLVSDGVNTAKTDLATFSIQERKTWRYSDTVKNAELEVKMLKEAEESNGTAQVSITKSLRVQLI